MMNGKWLFGLLIPWAVIPLGAEVYWLGPGRNSGNADRLQGILPGVEKVLFSEKITVRPLFYKAL